MRLLDRNKQTVYYRTYSADSYLADGNLITGEHSASYGSLKSVRCYVKSAMGENSAEPFGDLTSKKRVAFIERIPDGFDEFAILWVGINPSPDTNGEPTVPHNFTVSGIAKGLNHNRITISQVEVSQ